MKKPKFPFWIMRLPNLQLAVLGDALMFWLEYKVDATQDEIDTAEHLVECIAKIAEKRAARREAAKEPS